MVLPVVKASLSLLLLLTSVCLPCDGATDTMCSFPELLRRRPRWESDILMERTQTNLYVKFHASSMELVDYRYLRCISVGCSPIIHAV